MAVNVTANWRLIRSMDPLLKASAAGRAVFVTSGAAWKAYAYWGPYGISKAALDVLVRTYAAETLKTAIRVNLLSPGPTRTKMRAAAMPGEDPLTLPPPEALADVIVAMCGADVSETGQVFDFRTGRYMQFHGGPLLMPRTPYPWRSILVSALFVAVATLVLDAPPVPQQQAARTPLPWSNPDTSGSAATESIGAPQWTTQAKPVDPAADGLSRLPDALPKNPFPLVIEVPRHMKVIDAATFQIADRSYRLLNITPVPPAAECARRGGGRWNCGARSRSALRGLMVNKAIQCRSLDAT
eukprot:gene45525-60833_t